MAESLSSGLRMVCCGGQDAGHQLTVLDDDLGRAMQDRDLSTLGVVDAEHHRSRDVPEAVRHLDGPLGGRRHRTTQRSHRYRYRGTGASAQHVSTRPVVHRALLTALAAGRSGLLQTVRGSPMPGWVITRLMSDSPIPLFPSWLIQRCPMPLN